VEVLRKLGVDSELCELWPNSLAKLMLKDGRRSGHLLFKYVVSPIYSWLALKRIRRDDIVWMYDISLYGNIQSLWFEKALKTKGARYIFQLHDNWLSVPGYREAALKRLDLADLVACLTPGLRNAIRGVRPQMDPQILRGPIDVLRLQALDPPEPSSIPKVIWTGNPKNLKEIPNAREMLGRVFAKHPFDFVVISGCRKPALDLTIPWRWFPYDSERESERISGSCAGLAPLEDTAYARCKDVFKVKTYMACGVPPVATAIGNSLEVIRDGETGFLVDSQVAWEERLLELVTSPRRARVMGMAARKQCVEQYSHAAIIPEWIAVLENRFGKIRESL